MAQDLKKISVESFRVQIYKVPTDQLERLREQIYEIKRSSIGNYLVDDLERKETIIIAEMMRRGYLKHKEKPEDLKDMNRLTEKYRGKRRLF